MAHRGYYGGRKSRLKHLTGETFDTAAKKKPKRHPNKEKDRGKDRQKDTRTDRASETGSG
jgi:hypothetical protein